MIELRGCAKVAALRTLSLCSQAAIFLTCSLLACGSAAVAQDRVEYNRDVRPILFDACIACHGPDSAARQADLRLDQREAAIEMAAIEPGEPEISELIRRIHSDDPAEQMPPPETKKTLTPQQMELLTRWIREGAEYQPHWSLIPPTRPGLPVVENDQWARNPIDRFVLARLQSAGLRPAAEADRRTLARRLSLDLTGLPPTPAVVEAFVNDPDPNAYENLVDQLLASPHWGEHRGRYWLDIARYADTHGIHFDNYREMWSYRDWVIDAFNRNLPFDQFTIESLAGDMLPDATLDQQIASGFNRCNITTNEGGVIEEEYAVLYARDRTETTSIAWLGLTTGCAVCHDHKFDSFTQKEFYELAAFFNNTTQPVMDGNIKDTPPVIVVPPAEQRTTWEDIDQQLPQLAEKLSARHGAAREAFEAWLETATSGDIPTEVSTAGLHFAAGLDEEADSIRYLVDGEAHEATTPATIEWRDGLSDKKAAYFNKGQALEAVDVGDFEGDQAFSVALWVKLPANDSVGTLVARMQDPGGARGWDLRIEQRHIGAHLVNKWPQSALKVQTKQKLKPDVWHHVTLNYDGSRKGAGLQIYVDGQFQELQIHNDSLTGTIRVETPFKVGQRLDAAPLSGTSLTEVRVYRRELDANEVLLLSNTANFTALDKPPAERTQQELDRLYAWWLRNLDEDYSQTVAERDRLLRKKLDIQRVSTIAHVMQEGEEPAMAHVLNRGEYDQRGEQVSPDTPDMLPEFPAELSRDRLGLAKWLLLPDQPLTARVAVNRFWQELFGTGLVSTAGDFGVSGELPSHPLLLDWLAVEFRESGWDIKQLYKLMVTSATYRQSAATTPQKLDADPDNRLFSRGPRFRMDAEMVRDYALAASGVLVDQRGGQSVKTYQPEGVWEAVAMIGSNTRDYRRDKGDALYRRSIYTFWKRSAPPASLEIFNAPSRESCVMRRERTNTPLQALATLNDPQLIEAARQLATQAIQEAGPDVERRLQWLGERVLARPLREAEALILRVSRDELSAHYQSQREAAQQLIETGESSPDGTVAPDELAAWTMIVNQMLNLDEALNK